MSGRISWILVAIVAVFSACSTPHGDAPDASAKAALREYSQKLKAGLTRKEVEEYLKAAGTGFVERSGENGSLAILVKVGEETKPWYCSEWPDYLAFEFVSQTPSPCEGCKSEVLKEMHLTSNGEGCL
jgi:hypothetical protein